MDPLPADLSERMFPTINDRFKSPRQLAPSAIPMIAFYHAGGMVANLRKFCKSLDEATEGWAVNPIWVELPGRGVRSKEPLVTDCRAICQEIAQGIATSILQKDVRRPFLVFGHSNGCLYGFEVIRVLQRWGYAPRAFVALSRQAPQIPMDRPEDNFVHGLSDHQFVEKMAKEYGQKALLEMWEKYPQMVMAGLPASRADMQNLQDYRFDGWHPQHEPDKLTCPIVAAVGEQDRASNHPEAVRAWRAMSSALDFDFAVFAGGHFFYTDAPEPFWRWLWPHLRKHLPNP